jgi:hypothetical protein
LPAAKSDARGLEPVQSGETGLVTDLRLYQGRLAESIIKGFETTTSARISSPMPLDLFA